MRRLRYRPFTDDEDKPHGFAAAHWKVNLFWRCEINPNKAIVDINFIRLLVLCHM